MKHIRVFILFLYLSEMGFDPNGTNLKLISSTF